MAGLALRWTHAKLHLQTQVQSTLTSTSPSKTSYGRKAWTMDWWAHLQRLSRSSGSKPPSWSICTCWSTRRCIRGLRGAKDMPAGLIQVGQLLTSMPQSDAIVTDLLKWSEVSTRKAVTCGSIPRPAGLGEAGRPGPATPHVHLHIQATLTIILLTRQAKQRVLTLRSYK
jgi:hypothetical protein